MKILMMGTGPFAVPTFEALVQSKHEVCGLITRPPAGSHRGKRKDINPMRESAEKLGLPIYDPQSVNDAEFAETLAAFNADLFVVCDYGQILSRDVLSLARLGGINLHGSLLPKYRGAAPINWAIFNGDKETGNSVILMTPRLDGGPIIKTVTLPIEKSDTAITIEEKLSLAGVEAVSESIAMLESWDGEAEIGKKQLKEEVTKAPRLKKTDGDVDWNRTAEQIFNQVRAFQPWPATYSNLIRGEQAATRLIFSEVDFIKADIDSTESNGSVVFVDKTRLIVQAAGSQLDLLKVQPAGKKSMPIADFLRGNAVKKGDRFESEFNSVDPG